MGLARTQRTTKKLGRRVFGGRSWKSVGGTIKNLPIFDH